MTRNIKREKRARRRIRIRAKISGTAERPRLSVFKSNTRLTAQLIDDDAGKTLLSVSSFDSKKKIPREQAEEIGAKLADAARKKKITKLVFDRGGFLYAGNIKVFADSVRAGGIKF